MRRNLLTTLERWLRELGLVAFALAIGSTFVVSGTLCIGEDGHVAVERAQGGRCVDGEPTTGSAARFEASAGLRAAGQGSHCGPCTDFTSAPSEWVPTAKQAQAHPSLALAAAPAVAGAAWPQSSPSLGARGAGELPARPFLRSTVLRC